MVVVEEEVVQPDLLETENDLSYWSGFMFLLLIINFQHDLNDYLIKQKTIIPGLPKQSSLAEESRMNTTVVIQGTEPTSPSVATEKTTTSTTQGTLDTVSCSTAMPAVDLQTLAASLSASIIGILIMVAIALFCCRRLKCCLKCKSEDGGNQNSRATRPRSLQQPVVPNNQHTQSQTIPQTPPSESNQSAEYEDVFSFAPPPTQGRPCSCETCTEACRTSTGHEQQLVMNRHSMPEIRYLQQSVSPPRLASNMSHSYPDPVLPSSSYASDGIYVLYATTAV